jgi:protease IV
MKGFLARMLMSIGFLAVVLLMVVAGYFLFAWMADRTLPDKIVLEADFERAYAETAREGFLERFSLRETPRLFDVTTALARAAEDDRVVMLVAKVSSTSMRTGKIQEIREAVLNFRATGKPAIAYAESFGEFAVGNTAYHLATAFDRIYLQPSGDLGLTGLRSRTPFIRELLDKVGVQPNLDHREEYKSAAYIATRKEYNEPHREADQAVLDSLMSVFVEDIARSRQLSPDAVLALVGQGPYTAAQARDVNLVDELAYRDQVYDQIEQQLDEQFRPIPLLQYLRRAGSPYRGEKRIALIYAEGSIARGKNRDLPPGRRVVGSDTVAEAFRQAIDDNAVEAIILRINSPGGSYIASDSVWHTVVQARKKGKPVIVSMSEVAGSGGYFMAAPANRIIAHPGTVTGSIGVVAGKMVTAEMWNKIGVHWGELYTHENALLWSTMAQYTPEQWERLEKWMDNIYQDFVGKVAQGRNLEHSRVEQIAKGRIWTGLDAKALGLVDELGGFAAALRAAKAEAGIPQEENVSIRIFPIRRPIWRQLIPGRQETEAASALVGNELLDHWIALAAAAGVFDPPGLLQMRPLIIE